MTPEKVYATTIVVKRFLEAADKFLDRAKEDKYVANGCCSKEGGALRRASMDLTRSLAEMRKA